MTIQGCDAARQPLTTLLSFGFVLTRLSPISNRAETFGWAAIKLLTSGRIGSLARATQNRIS
jgi:hypothetical protein